MPANTFLFTGEESYLVEKEVKRWKTSFGQKYGTGNISVYTTNNFDVQKIAEDLWESGLFAEKKLIILYGVPDDTFAGHKLYVAQTDQLATLLEERWEQINGDAIVIFVAYKPDKRKKLYKFLIGKVTKHQEFPVMTGRSLVSFLLEQSNKLDQQHAEYIVERVGLSVARNMTELAKLETYTEVHGLEHIDMDTIDKIVYGDIHSDAFALLDVIYVDREKALHTIELIQNAGMDRNQLIGALYWGARFLLMYVDCLERKVPSKEIAKEIGIHPFVLSKHSKHYELILSKKKHFVAFLDALLELDYGIKTGAFDQSVFWLQLKMAVVALNKE